VEVSAPPHQGGEGDQREPEGGSKRRPIGPGTGPGEQHRLGQRPGDRPATCHGSLYTLPAALAEVEATGGTLGDLLTAVVLGYEVVTRVARAYRPPVPLALHPHATLSRSGRPRPSPPPGGSPRPSSPTPCCRPRRCR
jgi:hypothetical protein